MQLNRGWRSLRLYEAENAAYERAEAKEADGASGGRIVHFLPQPGSRVTFPVQVTSTGTYTLAILYVNGTPGRGKNDISVNGGEPRTVTYPATDPWNTFDTALVKVNLRAGSNVITLTKGAGFPQIDYITVNRDMD